MKFFAPVLLLGACCVYGVFGGSHSLRYFYTASSEISGFPEFVAVGMVDNTQFIHFDSNSKKAVPKQDWVDSAADPQYWERQTQGLLGSQQSFKANIDIAKQRFNQTGGKHVFQWYYGCEWDDVTETKNAFDHWGYDGNDLISLDLVNLRYIAAVPQALPTKQKWDNPAQLESQKQYYTSICIDWLKKYVQYGSSILQRKVVPKVSLFQKGSSAVVCHATGFYPEAVMITWKRDGQEVPDDIDVGETLPNADGNFQKTAVLTVPPEERKNSKYTCEVAHSSGEPIVMILNEDDIKPRNTDTDSVPLGLIIGVVVGLLVLIAVIAGIVVLRNKNKSGFARANTDESSQSSGEKA